MRSPIATPLNPYLALGLRGNPFIGAEVPGVPARDWIDRGWSQAPPPQARQLVQVIGDRGIGKTSHLLHWQSQTGGPYCYYPAGWGRFKLPVVQRIAYWDEADRIPLPFLILALAWATITNATIVVGTHADRGKIAALFGLTLQSIHLPPLDREVLMRWARDRIEAAQLPDRPCHLALTPEQSDTIVAIAEGSWRVAADYLHIWAAEVANHFENPGWTATEDWGNAPPPLNGPPIA